MRTAFCIRRFLKNIRMIIGIIMFLPVIASGKIPVHFFPHDYEGFKTASNPKAKANKRVAKNRICKAPLVGLDLARSYAGGKKCLKNIQSPSGLLSNKIDYVILVDDTQKMSSYLTSLLADQKVLGSVNGKQIVSPTLLEFKGRESDLKVLVVGESHYRNLTGTNKEEKWFTTLDVIETHIFPALKELTNQSSPAEFGFREKPLQVSSGNRESQFKQSYNECSQKLVSYIKQREFGLQRIGGPNKRCVGAGPVELIKLAKKKKINRKNMWYAATGADSREGYARCEARHVKNPEYLNLIKNTSWYKNNIKTHDSNISDHEYGNAVDYFTRKKGGFKGKTKNILEPTQRELHSGNNFKDWIQKKDNWSKYKVDYIIWNKRQYNNFLDENDKLNNPEKYNKAVVGKEYPAYKSRPHTDHIHVEHLDSCKPQKYQRNSNEGM